MADSGKDFLVSGVSGFDAMARSRVLQAKARLEQVKLQAEGSKSGQLESSVSEKDAEQIRAAATDFEALLLHQMLNTMWKTVPKGGLVSGSREEEMYRDMLNEQLAQQIAQDQGIGIKEVIMRELESKQSK